MGTKHTYSVSIHWTGNNGTGTSSYRDYERSHAISAEGKPVIAASSDAAFRGDRSRWNPQELLVAALSSCHQLAYPYLCAVAGIVVTGYLDHSEGVMEETADGAGRFIRVVLRPKVTVASGNLARAKQLHHQAHAKCFIASSVNFPVEHQPEIVAD